MTVDESDLAMIRPNQRRRVSPWAAGLAGVVIGAAAVGVAWTLSGSGTGTQAKPFTLRGTLDLKGDHIPTGPTNSDCTGNGGYNDIAEGAQVSVFNASGAVVAEGSLGKGAYADPANFTGDCMFPLTVTGVPSGAAFYQVEITHRGKLTVSSAEAVSGSFAATLGN